MKHYIKLLPAIMVIFNYGYSSQPVQQPVAVDNGAPINTQVNPTIQQGVPQNIAQSQNSSVIKTIQGSIGTSGINPMQINTTTPQTPQASSNTQGSVQLHRNSMTSLPNNNMQPVQSNEQSNNTQYAKSKTMTSPSNSAKILNAQQPIPTAPMDNSTSSSTVQNQVQQSNIQQQRQPNKLNRTTTHYNTQSNTQKKEKVMPSLPRTITQNGASNVNSNEINIDNNKVNKMVHNNLQQRRALMQNSTLPTLNQMMAEGLYATTSEEVWQKQTEINNKTVDDNYTKDVSKDTVQVTDPNSRTAFSNMNKVFNLNIKELAKYDQSNSWRASKALQRLDKILMENLNVFKEMIQLLSNSEKEGVPVIRYTHGANPKEISEFLQQYIEEVQKSNKKNDKAMVYKINCIQQLSNYFKNLPDNLNTFISQVAYYYSLLPVLYKVK